MNGTVLASIRAAKLTSHCTRYNDVRRAPDIHTYGWLFHVTPDAPSSRAESR